MTIWTDTYGWPVPPVVLLACLVAEVLYFRGWRVFVKAVQVREAARAAKLSPFTGSATGEYSWNRWLWRGVFFLCAIFTFLLASSAPVDILSARFFWVHMVQHLLMLVVMPPLLVAAAPLIPLWLGLPRRARRLLKRLRLGHVFYRLGQWLRQPAITCVLLVTGIWIWHWPPLYDLALTNGAIHDWGEHATFVTVSTLFWSQVIPSPPLRLRAGYLGRIICVGVAVAQNLVLAVLIGFAQTPLYAPYAHPGASGGSWLTPIQDQQLGAGIMWTFGDLPFGIALAVLVGRWLSSESEDTGAAPQPGAKQAVKEQRV